MKNPREVHAMDQAIASMMDYARALYTFYESAIRAGFKEEQAFYLTTEYMKTMIAAGAVKPKEGE